MLFVSRQHSARLFTSSGTKCLSKGLLERGMATKTLTKAEQEKRRLDEIQMQALDRMASSDVPVNFDIKAQRLQIFDVRLPIPITKTAPGFKAKLDWVRTAVMDKIRSVMGLRQAYKVGILPAPKPSLPSLFRLDSPILTSRALSLYTQMNDAFARGDIRSLSRTCAEEQFERLRQRLRTRSKDQTIIWRGEEGKAKVLSLRCLDAWQTKKPEDHCAQALVRFDTRQSIAVYGTGGKLLSGNPQKTIPVREYLVLEKKNWESRDWAIREQMHTPK